MNCNGNNNLSFCGEYLSVNSGYCGVAGIVAKGNCQDTSRTAI